MDENLSEVRYQFFTLKFTPLVRINKSSKDITFDIVTFKKFEFKYEDKDGNEELFNLISGKQEIKI